METYPERIKDRIVMLLAGKGEMSIESISKSLGIDKAKIIRMMNVLRDYGRVKKEGGLWNIYPNEEEVEDTYDEIRDRVVDVLEDGRYTFEEIMDRTFKVKLSPEGQRGRWVGRILSELELDGKVKKNTKYYIEDKD